MVGRAGWNLGSGNERGKSPNVVPEPTVANPLQEVLSIMKQHFRNFNNGRSSVESRKGGAEDTPAVLSLGKLCDEHGYSYEWINGQKPHLIKNGIRFQCNTENFVPIVVPGLSTSSSSSLSTSTPRTSSTVSSESEDRQERGDPYGIDHYPAIESSESVWDRSLSRNRVK